MMKLPILTTLIILSLSAPVQADAPESNLASGQQAMESWKVCLFQSAGHYAQISREPATTVANAAFGHCSDVENRVQVTWTKLVGTEKIDQFMTKVQISLHEQMVAGIIETRSRHNH